MLYCQPVHFQWKTYNCSPLGAVTFSWWGIAYLNDLDSYAAWSFYTPGRVSQARQVEGQRSDKVVAQSLLSLYFTFFSPLLSYSSPLYFS